MKILIVGDLHGAKPKIYFEDYDAIIAPGDFCSDKSKKILFKALKEKLKNPDSAIEWYDMVGKRKARKIINESLDRGREILEHLNSFGKPVYLVPGNWEWTGYKDSDWEFLRQNHYPRIKKGLKNIRDTHNRMLNMGDYSIIGYGISSGPEFPQQELEKFTAKELKKKKREFEKTKRKLEKLFEKTDKPMIFLSHNVPYNTPLDMITDKASPRVGMHFGSVVVRDLIDKYHPLVSVGGHMHEHFDKCKLGRTTCINSGFGPNVNVLMELKGNKIKVLEFYRGK